MKIKVEVLNRFIKTCSKVFELSFSSSVLYSSLENEDVAMIESAVMVKPIVIDKKVATVSNAVALSKFQTVENSKIVNKNAIVNVIGLMIFITNNIN